jgi:hypothetical protein
MANDRSSHPLTGWKKVAAAGGLVLAGLTVGGALAGAASASADPSTPAATGSSSSVSGPVDQSRGQRSDEQLLTGDAADKVRAAALAKYPGATIQRVETDSDGVYEAHLLTAAGDRVTVEMGKDYVVTGDEAGGPGAAPAASGTASTGPASTGTASA